MLRTSWIARGFVGFFVLGVIASVVLGILASSGDLAAASRLTGEDVKLSGDLQQLSASVGQLDGVATSSPKFAPLHLPEPAGTLDIRMAPHATVKSAVAALSLVQRTVATDKLPASFLSVTLVMPDGAVMTEQQVITSDRAITAAVTAWWSLESATHLRLPLAVTASGDGVSALVGRNGTPSSKELRILQSAYASALGGVKDSALIKQWSSADLSTTGGMPPRTTWAQYDAALKSARSAGSSSGVQLTWSGIYAARSSIVVFVPDAPSYASADAVFRSVATVPVSVKNLYYESTRSSAVVEYGLHVGACSGSKNVLASDSAYFAHFVTLGVALPAGSGPGGCL